MNLQEDYKPPAPKRADAGILEHERKRQIELKIAIFRDAMEERKCAPIIRYPFELTIVRVLPL